MLSVVSCAWDLQVHQVRVTVVNLGQNFSILFECLGIFSCIHLQPWCVKASQALYRDLIQNTVYTCSLLLEFCLSNVKESLCKPPESYNDHIALPEVISHTILLRQ